MTEADEGHIQDIAAYLAQQKPAGSKERDMLELASGAWQAALDEVLRLRDLAERQSKLIERLQTMRA